MTTVAHGPYEHTGAYADLVESEQFDTSGTPADFCAGCEHAPCVADSPGYCEKRPVFFVRRQLREEMLALIEEVGGPGNPLAAPLRTAMYGVTDPAMFSRDLFTAASAYADMVRLLLELRKAKEALSHVHNGVRRQEVWGPRVCVEVIDDPAKRGA
jgi:hypothetical protein